VSYSISELQQPIRSRCQHGLNALGDCPKAGLLFFYQAVRQVLSASGEANEEGLRGVQLRLNDVIEALKVTRDGNGEAVLGPPPMGEVHVN
jgi:hypothetical protein